MFISERPGIRMGYSHRILTSLYNNNKYIFWRRTKEDRLLNNFFSLKDRLFLSKHWRFPLLRCQAFIGEDLKTWTVFNAPLSRGVFVLTFLHSPPLPASSQGASAEDSFLVWSLRTVAQHRHVNQLIQQSFYNQELFPNEVSHAS